MQNKRIVVVGVGGCGVNAIVRLAKHGIKSSELVAVDSDRDFLATIKGAETVFLSKLEAKPNITPIGKTLDGAGLVFIVYGVGGEEYSIGASYALIIASMAKERKARAIAVIAYPFSMEKRRAERAKGAIENMRKIADEVIIRDNNTLVKHIPDKTMMEAFNMLDADLGERISAVAESYSKDAKIGNIREFFNGWMYEG